MFTSSAGSSCIDLLSKKCFSKSSIGFFFLFFSFVPKAIFLEWILLTCWYTGSINEAICSSGTFWTNWWQHLLLTAVGSYGTVQCLEYFALLLLPCLSSLHSLFHSIVNSFCFWNLVLELHPTAYSIAQLVSQGYCCLLGLPNGGASVHFEKENGAARGGR